jgi:hypothetical protein
MSRLRPLSLLAFAALSAVLWTAACPGMDVCSCNLCDDAIELTVVEEGTQEPIEDFFIEVIRDGQSEGEPPTCQSAFREDNTCSFGDGPGVYVVVIQAPGYETLEATARVAAEAESEICCRACLSGKLLRVELSPTEFDG